MIDNRQLQENKDDLEKLADATSNEVLYDIVKIIRKGVINHFKESNNKED